jgi:hypothetical protein
MKFYKIWPILAGIPSEGCVGDLDSPGPQMSFVKCIIDLEPPSDLISCGSIVLAKQSLVEHLQALKPSGVTFHKDNLKVEGSANFADPHRPDFAEWLCLELTGEPGKDDFAYEVGVIVSDRVMDVLRKFKLDQCEVFDYP